MEPSLDSPSQQRSQMSLVVLGASAGGIEALSAVLTGLSPEFPCPIVIAQHLDPGRPSHLAEILARRSKLPVHTAVDQERLLPGVVYVVPADRDVEIRDYILHLHHDTGQHPKPSVNLLLSSAARVFGERLIAVVLSGTGSDGAAGAHAVKAAGGMVIIQNPDTASFPGMPASLAPTSVDVVADLEQIGPLLSDLVARSTLPLVSADGDTALDTLLEDLRQYSGIDFAHYKTPTILRRIQRRMAATGVHQLPDYQQFLLQHPDEYQRLIASFLINVTEFFRDPELFTALREQVIPDVIAQARERGNELRIWSAGCATGEEAYTLAILVAEALGEELDKFTVQIFATDLDAAAIAFARRGLYAAPAVEAVPEELRKRYFTQIDGAYEVTPRIRGLVIFGEHDLGQRAPFPHINLVLCRNVLIYFSSDLQRHALQLFAYSLQDGGYLVLGNAETANVLPATFVPAHPRLKIYRREGARLLIPPLPPKPLIAPRSLPLSRHVPAPGRGAVPSDLARAQPRVQTPLEQLGRLILGLSVGVVVVDRHYDVQAINDVAHRLLDIYRPAAGEDLIHLAERVPSTPLRALIDAAFRAASPPTSDATAQDAATPTDPSTFDTVVTFETVLGERRDLRISGYPQGSEADAHAREDDSPGTVGNDSVVLLVTDISRQAAAHRANETTPRARKGKRRGEQEEIAEMRAQLQRMTASNRQLVSAAEELTAANARMQRDYEVLQVNHEDTQAAIEEVRTLNEEMQATNEELETLNEEMEATVEELRTANDDLQARTTELQRMAQALTQQRQVSEDERARLTAVLSSMSDAVLVVDEASVPVRTNAAYEQLFGGVALVPQDETGMDLPPEATPQQRAARGETFNMQFTLPVDTGMRRVFDVSGGPILGEGQVGGVVVIRDVTERSFHRLQDQFMGMANHELRTPLAALKGYVQLAARRLRSDLREDATLSGDLAGALAQVQRLQRLVEDLLDVRRLQSDRFSLKLGRLALDAVVRHAVETAQMSATGRTIALSIEDASLLIWGDADRLEQVLLNLLTNAFIYAPTTSQIEVRLRRVSNEAEIQVQDYGSGIPATELPHLFLRFYQGVSSEARRANRGLGLGLYIADQIVRGHSGRIVVTSEVGQGSTFTIRLPLLNELEHNAGVLAPA